MSTESIADWLHRLERAQSDLERVTAIATEIERFAAFASVRLAAARCKGAAMVAAKNGATDHQLAVARNAVASLRHALQEVAE